MMGQQLLTPLPFDKKFTHHFAGPSMVVPRCCSTVDLTTTAEGLDDAAGGDIEPAAARVAGAPLQELCQGRGSAGRAAQGGAVGRWPAAAGGGRGGSLSGGGAGVTVRTRSCCRRHWRIIAPRYICIWRVRQSGADTYGCTGRGLGCHWGLNAPTYGPLKKWALHMDKH